MTTAIEIKERPILFSGPMVRAILEGRKTQTRRVVKPQPQKLNDEWLGWVRPRDIPREFAFLPGIQDEAVTKYCPYGKPGDRLWVRETWRVVDNDTTYRTLIYRYEADQPTYPTIRETPDYFSYVSDNTFEKYTGVNYSSEKRPSIFMPRWASRITLEITDVRVERLNQISGRDACWEGAPYETIMDENHDGRNYLKGFQSLWETINGKKYPWSSNPWVWVVEFKRIEA